MGGHTYRFGSGCHACMVWRYLYSVSSDVTRLRDSSTEVVPRVTSTNARSLTPVFPRCACSRAACSTYDEHCCLVHVVSGIYATLWCPVLMLGASPVSCWDSPDDAGPLPLPGAARGRGVQGERRCHRPRPPKTGMILFHIKKKKIVSHPNKTYAAVGGSGGL